MSTRLETGVVQVGGDWPGVFIRGDNAMDQAMHLSMILANNPDMGRFERNRLEGLMRLLAKCNMSRAKIGGTSGDDFDEASVQRIRPDWQEADS